jgi:hypothetical protein
LHAFHIEHDIEAGTEKIDPYTLGPLIDAQKEKRPAAGAARRHGRRGRGGETTPVVVKNDVRLVLFLAYTVERPGDRRL